MSTTLALINETTTNAHALTAAMPAESLTDKGTNIVNDARSLVLAVVGLLAIVIGIITTWRTKSMAGAISGFAVGALLVFFAANVSSEGIQNPIRDQINSGNG